METDSNILISKFVSGFIITGHNQIKSPHHGIEGPSPHLSSVSFVMFWWDINEPPLTTEKKV